MTSLERTLPHPVCNVVRLLGRFEAQVDGRNLEAFRGRKTTELLSFLLLFRDRPHHREVLAGTLWPESETEQSKKYLRQSIWQLRAASGCGPGLAPLLTADTEWVQVNSAQLWLDVGQLEEAYTRVKLTPGERLNDDDAAELARVVPLYRGDLLEGCYKDWCTYERERLKALYLALLERLLAYYEATCRPEEGVVHGELLLRHDRAHERAHRRLMRLRYQAGDRTGAIRQFERCREALREEFGIAPGERTRLLYEQLKSDDRLPRLPDESNSPGSVPATPRTPQEIGETTVPASKSPSAAVTSPHHVAETLGRSLAALAEATGLVEDSLQALRQTSP